MGRLPLDGKVVLGTSLPKDSLSVLGAIAFFDSSPEPAPCPKTSTIQSATRPQQSQLVGSIGDQFAGEALEFGHGRPPITLFVKTICDSFLALTVKAARSVSARSLSANQNDNNNNNRNPLFLGLPLKMLGQWQCDQQSSSISKTGRIAGNPLLWQSSTHLFRPLCVTWVAGAMLSGAHRLPPSPWRSKPIRGTRQKNIKQGLNATRFTSHLANPVIGGKEAGMASDLSTAFNAHELVFSCVIKNLRTNRHKIITIVDQVPRYE
ncbi:hypothetical protein CCM_04848 [Cordyceps militaris CM01]|uniref:Uncharacterized protein n=1 Tax=Cordyceps militaris (strain CM01) TaxID=983644 RepID=G3JEY1_CORMM|nr:uncharacterized protein CCM_04848 [Cordyceps militaris CM01]EGX93474.1 hypothetical protein CCM_04848 [Cordyceps militaris CM01]